MEVHKTLTEAPRAGIAAEMKPSVKYAVKKVYNNTKRRLNVLIQTVTIYSEGKVRIKDAYVSPSYK